MIKRKIDSYLRHFFETSNNALLLTGARQVGKTSSVREFGKSFRHFAEVNFVENPGAAKALGTAGNSRELLTRLSLIVKEPLVKGETLIFFDEVQECPEIVTAIKFLVEEGSYRYILSGSLLGVELNDLRSEPVGYLAVREMFPLDFEEFIEAQGVRAGLIDELRQAWETHAKVDDFVHAKLMELFRLYLVVGGMPAAVSCYLKNNNLREVLELQRQILNLYRRDIAKYDPESKLYLKEIFDLIPAELNSKNKRFILKSLRDKARARHFENSFLWLKHAGVAIPVYNVAEPKVPLLLNRSNTLFKLFSNDVGLLCAMYGDGIQLKILTGDDSVNFGAVYENAVAQELTAHGFAPCYFNSKKHGELDFVVEDSGEALPIEVKSGKDYLLHRALSNVMNIPDFHLNRALVLCNGNVRTDGPVVYAPVYMSMFLLHKDDAPKCYRIDLSGLC